MKKKILIDLDVVTVGTWDRGGEKPEIARGFMRRVERKEFEVVTPFFMIEMVLQWRYEELRESIKEFYIRNSSSLISDMDYKERAKELDIDTETITKTLEDEGVKQEDSILVIMTSIFDLDHLVTFNRKHLRNKRDAINKILREKSLRAIDILEPNEI